MTRTGQTVVARDARESTCARLTLNTNSLSCQGDISLSGIGTAGRLSRNGASSLHTPITELASMFFAPEAGSFSMSSADETPIVVSLVSDSFRACSRKSSLMFMRLDVEWKSVMEEMVDIGRELRLCDWHLEALSTSGDKDMVAADGKSQLQPVQICNGANL